MFGRQTSTRSPKILFSQCCCSLFSFVFLLSLRRACFCAICDRAWLCLVLFRSKTVCTPPPSASTTPRSRVRRPLRRLPRRRHRPQCRRRRGRRPLRHRRRKTLRTAISKRYLSCAFVSSPSLYLFRVFDIICGAVSAALLSFALWNSVTSYLWSTILMASLPSAPLVTSSSCFRGVFAVKTAIQLRRRSREEVFSLSRRSSVGNAEHSNC